MDQVGSLYARTKRVLHYFLSRKHVMRGKNRSGRWVPKSRELGSFYNILLLKDSVIRGPRAHVLFYREYRIKKAWENSSYVIKTIQANCKLKVESAITNIIDL